MMRHVRAKARGKWQENTAGQTNTQTLTLSVTSELCGCKKAALYGLLSLRANLSDSRYRAFSLVKHRVTTTESLLVIAVTTQRGSCGRADASYFPDKSAFLDRDCATLGDALLPRKPYQPSKCLVFKPEFRCVSSGSCGWALTKRCTQRWCASVQVDRRCVWTCTTSKERSLGICHK